VRPTLSLGTRCLTWSWALLREDTIRIKKRAVEIVPGCFGVVENSVLTRLHTLPGETEIEQFCVLSEPRPCLG